MTTLKDTLVYVYICLCSYVCLCGGTPKEGVQRSEQSFDCWFLPYILFDIGSLCSLLCRLVPSFWHFSCVYIPSPYRCTQKCIMDSDITVSCFYMTSGDLNSDCQVWRRRALPTEPYPWPFHFNNFKTFLQTFEILQVSLSCILIFLASL